MHLAKMGLDIVLKLIQYNLRISKTKIENSNTLAKFIWSTSTSAF